MAEGRRRAGVDRKTSVGAAVHPGAFAHAIPSTVIQETSEVWYQFINSEVSAKPNAALPPELRPTAQPKRGEKLHDEVVIGTPFNVHQWRPQFGLPPEACETLSVNGFDIPILLVRLWDALKRHGGLEEEGIFRLAPDAAKCAALREALNTDGDALERVGAEQDTHVLANLIKIWFRMLPTKLLAGVTAEQIRACDTGAQCMAVLLTLSPLRQGIFLWLLEMMSDVAEHGAENRMSERAVAIVVAPNLYDPPPMTPGDDAMAAVTYTQGMARFVTELLTHYVAVRGKVRREQGRDRHVSIRSAAGLRPPPPAGAAANDSQPSDASSSTTAPPADSCATSAFC